MQCGTLGTLKFCMHVEHVVSRNKNNNNLSDICTNYLRQAADKMSWPMQIWAVYERILCRLSTPFGACYLRKWLNNLTLHRPVTIIFGPCRIWSGRTNFILGLNISGIFYPDYIWVRPDQLWVKTFLVRVTIWVRLDRIFQIYLVRPDYFYTRTKYFRQFSLGFYVTTT